MTGAANPRERSIVLMLAFIQFANIVDFVMVMPLGPDLAQALAISPSKLGYVGGVYMLAAALAGVIAARYLDRFDRRSALVTALVGLALGTASGALAFDFWSLLGARFLAGAFGGPATAICMAIIADVVPFERRGRAMATLMGGFSFASILGVPTGLWLARVGGWHAPFLGVAALVIGSAIIARTMLPSLAAHLATSRASIATKALLRRPGVVMSFALAAVQSFTIFLIIPNLSAYFQGNRGYERANLESLYLVGGLLNVVFIAASGKLVDRLGALPVALVGNLMLLAALLLGMTGPAPALPVMLTFILFMCSGGPRMVPMTTATSQVPAPHERGQFMSALSSAQNLAAAVAAMLSAVILGTSAVVGEVATAAAPARVVPLLRVDWLIAIAVGLTLVTPAMIWSVVKTGRQRSAGAAAASDPSGI